MKILFLPLLFLSAAVYGQANFTLSGKVSDCKTHALISNAKITLIGSDRLFVETVTDSNGIYSFDSGKFHKQTQYQVRTQISTAWHATSAGDKKQYLNSPDKFAFHTFEIDTAHFIHDFCLTQNEGCAIFNLPVMYFQKNSGTSYYIADSVFEFYFARDMMRDDPTLRIELRAHCTEDERQPEKMAVRRATVIKQLLIEQGIDPDRISITNALIVANEKKDGNHDKNHSVELMYRFDYSGVENLKTNQPSTPKPGTNEK